MRRLSAVALLLLAVSCGSGDTSNMVELSEASMNFDLDSLAPFLRRVSGQVDSGFGDAEISTLMAEVSAMAIDAEKQWNFSVVHGGHPTQLQVRVFMDDIEAPDVYFFTSATLAQAIDQEMKTYAEELGI